MKLSPEERRKINRENAARSTGPTSERGKMAVKFNAFKHGMRAESLLLPGEDPDVLEARAREWSDHFQPASDVESYLVEQAVKASLFLDRSYLQRTAVLAKQVREAPHAWQKARDEEITRLSRLLDVDPELAVLELKQTAGGCQWLLDEWKQLSEILDDVGYWSAPARNLAIRLQGWRPDDDRLRETTPAYLTRLYNLLCRPDPSDQALLWLFDPQRMPEELQSLFDPDALPAASWCQERLREIIRDETVPLEEELERLTEELDDPDLEESATRALLPQGEPEARLALRYHTTAENSFYRAYNALARARKEKGQEQDSGARPSATGTDTGADGGGMAAEAADLTSEAIAEAPETLPNKANPEPPPLRDSLPNKANLEPPPPRDSLPTVVESLPNRDNSALPNKANRAGHPEPESCGETTCDPPTSFAPFRFRAMRGWRGDLPTPGIGRGPGSAEADEIPEVSAGP